MTKPEVETLIQRLHALPPWTTKDAFGDREWSDYIEVARLVQQSSDADVVAALDAFISQTISEPYAGHTGESKPFLLMRVAFDLPESAPGSERFIFKGWTNWPEPDADGNLNLAWPLSWAFGQPRLLSDYEGSEGRPYAAAAEYGLLRRTFPPRELPGKDTSA